MAAISAVLVTDRQRPKTSIACRLPRVEGAPSKDSRLNILRLKRRIDHKRKERSLTINEVPMMLLPKARVRTTYDLMKIRGDACVIPDQDYNSLHLSTLHPDADFMRVRNNTSRLSFRSKSRCSRPSSRSDLDSGIGSLRRGVTFDDLSMSQSTVYKSTEDLDVYSEDEDVKLASPPSREEDLLSMSISSFLPSIDSDLPEHLDSYGETTSIADNNREKTKRNKFLDSWRRGRSRPQTPGCSIEPCHEDSCLICKGFMSEKERIQKCFGGVQNFLDWIFSKWGKRNELKNLPRSHYLYGRVHGNTPLSTTSIFRGRQPKFCNIVQQVQLHARDLRSPTPTRQMDEDYNDFDYIRKTIDGDMLRRRRKYSDTTRPKTASPRGHLSVPTSDSRRNDKHILSKNHRRNVSPKRKLSSWCKRRCGGTEEHSFDDVDLRKVEPPVEEEEKTSGTEGRPTSPSSQDGDTKIDVTIMGLEKAPSPPLRGNWSPTVTDINPKSQPESEDLTSLLDNPVSATDTKKSDTPTLFLHNDTELDGTGGPPAQPPPTPEILTPKEPVEEKPATKRPRTCTKKTKVPITKTRKPKEEMEKKEDETAKVETPLPAPPPEESKEEKDIKVNIAVPELPTYQKDENQRKTKEKRKSERHLVVKPKFEPKDDPVDQLDEDLKARIREFDWSTMEMTGSEESPRKQQKAAWVTGRLALSQQSSRFELPMDMRVLESMTTQEYIREYCKITKRRQKLYSDVFRKNAKQKERNVYVIPFKDLRKALMDVLVNTLTDDHYSMLVEHMAFAQDAEIDLVLFSALSALAERLMYPQFVTQETVDMPDYMKEKIECADFGALRWKMQGVNVSPGIKKLLLQLS
ncbi:uncharacterized protein LOC110458542 isoform X2 [Mizuhopecten yessoensis]|uniref:uncharacterized protein LOC110458542 isoform X2 n=1 Tax=Mizuhopecten yessoensis TaxID=6573 RepID=UPI000B458DA5|nr:uncharacterized protein LOC110458542 isoform X2 [Mizuhopecten yessoensis]